MTGCTTLFLFYIADQLGIGIEAIINAGGATLADVYRNLRLPGDAWTSFSDLVNSHYPPELGPYAPAGESVFPVSELSAFFHANQLTAGYGGSTKIFIDKPAKAEVRIRMQSDDPDLIVDPVVTIPTGGMSADVNLRTNPIRVPFLPKTVNLHATYGGKTLTIPVEIVPVRMVSATFVPDTVTCGDPATLVKP